MLKILKQEKQNMNYRREHHDHSFSRADKFSVSAVIPCYNEETTIEKTILSCLRQSRKIDQIIVVNDGSTDGTMEILKKYRQAITIVDVKKNSGNKSHAQQRGIRFVTGDIFVMVDADTELDRDFTKHIVMDFLRDDVTAVAGYIKSMKHNILTGCREIDYFVGQVIYKRAQAYLNYVYVMPGCSTAFRTEFFKNNISFDHDTITEDLDFTYQTHKLRRKILFNTKAHVYTQDPPTMHSYINQMRRWYGGGWQNLHKHYKIIFKKPSAALILFLMYADGLYYSAILLTLPFLNPSLIGVILLSSYTFALILGSLSAVIRRRPDLLLSIMIHPLIKLLDTYIFFETFFQEIILHKKRMIWFNPQRVSL